MADQLEYIVSNALMVCDKGAAPAFFLSTHNTHVKIQGCLVANKLDKQSLVNIPTFGICSVTQKPCVPGCMDWQKTYKLKVNGAETLLFRSEMPCHFGGKISFVTSGQIPLPADVMDDIMKLQKQGAQPDDTGWSWLDAVELIPVVGSIVGAVREGMKGNWGLMSMNVGFLVMDVAGLVSFGATTAASTAGKAAVKTGIKAAAKSAIKVASKQIGKSGLKTAVRLTAKGAMKAFRNSIDKIIGKASAGKLCVFACFPAGTKINTDNGLKNIEEIKTGDRVWSYNEKTGAIGLQEIMRTMVRESDHTVELYTDEESIETTSEHPFLTNNGWKDAADLQKGDRIKSRNKEDVEIKNVKFSYKSKKVYNFEVANWHTYIVGARAWIVHNAKKCLSKLPKQIHHFATNKSKKYTQKFKRIAKKYRLDLDGGWNKELLPHRGRHPYKYHDWVLKRMRIASNKAGGSQEKFLELFEKNVKSVVRKNPEILRKSGWEK